MKKDFVSVLITVIVATFLVSGFVYAVTTIGTNITTTGDVTVSTGDLDINGNFLTLDADADTQFRTYADDVLTLDVGGAAATGGYTFSATALTTILPDLDINGNFLTLDADADTQFRTYADDVLTLDVGGAAATGGYTFSATALTTILPDIDINGNFLTIDADADTQLRAYVDDIISVDIGGAGTQEYSFSGTALDLNDNNLTTSGDILSSDTGDIGWSMVASANQACSTTCTNACVFGEDTGVGQIVDCADATADRCICAGAN